MWIVPSIRAAFTSWFTWPNRKAGSGPVDKVDPESHTQVSHQPPAPRTLFSSLKRKFTTTAVQNNAPSDAEPDSDSISVPPSPTSHSTLHAIIRSMKILLDITASIVDEFPPCTGFKAFVGVAIALFEQYEKFDDNQKDLKVLQHKLGRLIKLLQPSTEGPALSESARVALPEVLRDLEPYIWSIKKEIVKLNKPSPVWKKYLSAALEEKIIADLEKKISDMFHEIIMRLQLKMMKQHEGMADNLNVMAPQVNAIHRQLVLDKLMKAPNALPDGFGRKGCHSATRASVLRDIEGWIDDENSPQILCLSGGPGSGKTAIAVTVFQDIKDKVHIRSAGFFCSCLYEDASNPRNVFPTLAAQLAHREDVYSGVESLLHQQDPTLGDGVIQFTELLINPLNKLLGTRKTLLIIDGLNECRESDITLEVVETLLAKVPEVPSLKVLLCCLYDSKSKIFSRFFSRASDNHLLCRALSLDDVDSRELRRDLRVLVQEELQARKFNQKSISALTDSAESADCSFLVALTACRSEKIQPSAKLKVQLKTFQDFLSAGTNSIYSSYIEVAWRYVRDEQGDNEEPLHAALVIVAFGRNSLRLTDLATLVEVRVDQLRDFFSHFPDNVLNIAEEKVLLLHPSFQKYVSETDSKAKGSSMKDCPHLYITRRLLKLISCHLRLNAYSEETFRALSELDAIDDTLPYACRYWPEHLFKATICDNDRMELLALLREFFCIDLLHWIEALRVLTNGTACIYSLLERLKKWTEEHDSTPDDPLSPRYMASDAFYSFKSSRTAIDSSSLQVYHTFLLPLTHSGKRLAKVFQHIEPSVNIVEVSCHRRQVFSLDVELGDSAEESVQMIKFSQDATRIAVVRNGNIVIGNSSTQTFKAFLSKAESEAQTYINALFVGKESILLTSVSHSDCFVDVRLWNVVTQEPDKLPLSLQNHQPGSELLSISALSSDGSLVALLTSSKVMVWDTETWIKRLELPLRKDQYPQQKLLALSLHHVLVGLRLRRLTSLPVATPKTVTFDGVPVCAAFSLDGDTLAIAGRIDISLYRAILSKHPTSAVSRSAVIDLCQTITSLMFSPKEPFLAAVGPSFLRVWNIESNQPSMEFKEDFRSDTVSSFVFSENGRFLHCAHICPGSKDVVFDMRDIAMPIAAQQPVTALAMSSDGKVATGSKDGVVTIWDRSMKKVLQCWETLGERHHSAVTSVRFSQDGKSIASVSEDRAYFRDTKTGEPSQVPPEANCRFLPACAFSGDGALFLCIMKGRGSTRPTFGHLWDARSRRRLGDIEFEHHDYDILENEGILSITMSEGGERIAISGEKSLVIYTISYSESSPCVESSSRVSALSDPLCLYFASKDQVLSTACVFDIVDNQVLISAKIPPIIPDVYFKDGWIYDLQGKQRCRIPFDSESTDRTTTVHCWASSGSTLVFCTTKVKNVFLVSVPAFH